MDGGDSATVALSRFEFGDGPGVSNHTDGGYDEICLNMPHHWHCKLLATEVSNLKCFGVLAQYPAH